MNVSCFSNNTEDAFSHFLDLRYAATSYSQQFFDNEIHSFSTTTTIHQKYKSALTFLSRANRYFLVQRETQVRSKAFFEYLLSLKFYRAGKHGTQWFSRTFWLISEKRKLDYQNGVVRPSSRLARVGQSLIFPAKAFPCEDFWWKCLQYFTTRATLRWYKMHTPCLAVVCFNVCTMCVPSYITLLISMCRQEVVEATRAEHAPFGILPP